MWKEGEAKPEDRNFVVPVPTGGLAKVDIVSLPSALDAGTLLIGISTGVVRFVVS